MQNLKNYSIIAILSLSLIAGIFSNIPLSYSQNDTTSSMTNMTTEAEEEEHATTEAGHAAEEEEEKEHNETTTVRDSVTELLQDKVMPGGDFIHLYDSTPDFIMNGHVALKAPCGDDNATAIQVLIGQAPNLTAASLEYIAPLSTPGEQCLYHADLVPGGNVTTITDIALSNPTDEEIEFPPTATVVIGINEIKKGEHESQAGHHNE